MLDIQLANPTQVRWCQAQVIAHHYLHRPVDARCSVVGYVVVSDGIPAGCLLFGRPESTRCYTGGLTYGSLADVAQGRAQYSRWEIVNLARVWLDPAIQKGGERYIQNAATQCIAMALRRVGYDYLGMYPPVFPDEPYVIRACLSYCDIRLHTGTIYKAAGFRLARQAGHIQTWVRALRPLRQAERRYIEKISSQSARGKIYRTARGVSVEQQVLL